VGATPGNYTMVVGSRLYAKQHEVTLTGLMPGRTYYFVVWGADLSGNQAQTGEYQARAIAKIYLPAVLRRR